MTDEELTELERLLRSASTGPWRHSLSTDDAMNDWLVAWRFGEDDDSNGEHFICTDRVRASEFNGRAAADADFIVAARNKMGGLIAEVRRLRGETERLRGVAALRWSLLHGAYAWLECAGEPDDEEDKTALIELKAEIWADIDPAREPSRTDLTGDAKEPTDAE